MSGGMDQLDHIDDIDEVTRENFELPLACNFMALAAYSVTCAVARAATMFLTERTASAGKHIHAVTVSDAFDAIDSIKKDGTESIGISADRLVGMLPVNAKLLLMMGRERLSDAVAGVIQHTLGHMMAVTPDMALAAHLHQLTSLPVVEHTIDTQLKKMAAELDEPEPKQTWPEVSRDVCGQLPDVLAAGGIELQLDQAIFACATVGARLAEPARLYDAYGKRLKAKADESVEYMRAALKREEQAQAEKAGEPAPAAPLGGDAETPPPSGSQRVQ